MEVATPTVVSRFNVKITVESQLVLSTSNVCVYTPEEVYVLSPNVYWPHAFTVVSIVVQISIISILSKVNPSEAVQLAAP